MAEQGEEKQWQLPQDTQDKIEQEYFRYSGQFLEQGRVIPEKDEAKFAGSKNAQQLIAFFKKVQADKKLPDFTAETELADHLVRHAYYEMLGEYVGDDATLIDEEFCLTMGETLEQFILHFEFGFQSAVIHRIRPALPDGEVGVDLEVSMRTLCMLLLDEAFQTYNATFRREYHQKCIQSVRLASTEKKLLPLIDESKFDVREWLLNQMARTQFRMNAANNEKDFVVGREVRVMALAATERWMTKFEALRPRPGQVIITDEADTSIRNWVYRSIALFWYLVTRGPAMEVRIPRVGDPFDATWMERDIASDHNGCAVCVRALAGQILLAGTKCSRFCIFRCGQMCPESRTTCQT